MIISNSTPLINFSAIHRLDILESLFNTIYIPKAVERELFPKGIPFPGNEDLRNSSFIKVSEIKNTLLYHSFRTDLDAGEAEAIILAIEQKAGLLILDELKARSVADHYDIPFTGSIGCLVEAKKKGIISAIRPLMDQMKSDASFWINKKLYHQISKDNDEL